MYFQYYIPPNPILNIKAPILIFGLLGGEFKVSGSSVEQELYVFLALLDVLSWFRECPHGFKHGGLNNWSTTFYIGLWWKTLYACILPRK